MEPLGIFTTSEIWNAVLKNQPRIQVVIFRVCKVSYRSKRSITLSDTAWQCRLNGCRHMPHISVQPAEDLSISVPLTAHVTVPLSVNIPWELR